LEGGERKEKRQMQTKGIERTKKEIEKKEQKEEKKKCQGGKGTERNN
jgi:hypothetical protein